MKVNNENGYVLVLGIVILAALLILVGIMTNLISSQLSFYRNNRDSSRAFYTAESGVTFGTEIFSFLNYKDSDEKITNNSISEDDLNKFNQKFSNSELLSLNWLVNTNTIIFNSTAKSNDIEKGVSVEYPILLDAFTNAITANKITYGNNITVDGNIAAPVIEATKNKEITYLSGEPIYKSYANISSYFEADFNIALAEKDNSMDTGSFEGLDYYSNTPSFPDIDTLSVVDEDDYSYLLDNNGTPKETHIYGDVELNHNFDGNGLLVIYGNLKIGNNVQINVGTDDFYSIIVKGNIFFGNSNSVKGFIYSEGDIYMENNGNLPYTEGIIYAEGTFDVGNPNAVEDGDFIYNRTAYDRLNEKISLEEGSGEYTVSNIISWNEL